MQTDKGLVVAANNRDVLSVSTYNTTVEQGSCDALTVPLV